MTDSDNVSSPLIIALDVQSRSAAIALAQRLDPSQVRLKVGKELFTLEGPSVVEALQQLGFQIFLDLKFHDIPNTVAAAVRAAASLGVWMVNVHASGGPKMLDAAVNAVAAFQSRPLLTAVTVLTSMDQQQLAAIGVMQSPMLQVYRLAQLAADQGCDGVVCSAQEAPELREKLGQNFTLVTPGIRPAGTDANDQSRICTPSEARAMGVDYLVIGRPVTQASDPAAVVSEILLTL